MESKCIICKDINPSGFFQLCCGESCCTTCMNETIGKPCPTCGYINKTLYHSEEYILRSFAKLAAQGHKLAIKGLPCILTLVASTSKNPKMKKELSRYKKKHGKINVVMGLTMDELAHMHREVDEMDAAGMNNGEINEFMKKKLGVRLKNEKTPEQVKAEPKGLCSAVTCSHCGLSDPEYTCGRCESVKFCNRGCQKAGWKIHKKQCNKKRKDH